MEDVPTIRKPKVSTESAEQEVYIVFDADGEPLIDTDGYGFAYTDKSMAIQHVGLLKSYEFGRSSGYMRFKIRIRLPDPPVSVG